MKNIIKRVLESNLSVCFLIAAIFHVSCGRTPKEEETLKELVCQTNALNVEFYIPLKINFIDGRFFVPDFHGERMIGEINREPFEWVGDFGVRGQGPVEFIGPLLTWEFDNKLFVFDRRGFKLGFFEVMIPDLLSVYKFTELFFVNNSINKLISLDHNTFLAAGYFEGGRYAILDSLGKERRFFGAYPAFMDGEDHIPFDAKAMFHQVKFTASYDKKRIAAISRHVVDIIDYSGPQPIIFSQIKLADYAYDYQSGDMLSNDLKSGFVTGANSVSSSQNFIYVLFNPLLKGEQIENEKIKQEVLVFNWEGEMIGKHSVPCELSLIKAIDDYSLFGISKELDFVTLSL